MADGKSRPTDSAAEEILSYSFFRILAAGGVLEEGELEKIRKLALRDGVVDSRERAVLGRIFDRVDVDRLAPPVREEIRRFREEHGIP